MTLFQSAKLSWDIQRTLSKGHKLPVLGAVIASPIKVAIGAIQFVGGLLVALAATVLALVPITAACVFGTFGSERGTGNCLEGAGHCGELATSALAVAGVGMFSMAYAIANILTLGVLGMDVEKTADEVKSETQQLSSCCLTY